MVANKKTPNPIDIHVGSRIRLRRTMIGLSQEKLGESLGIAILRARHQRPRYRLRRLDRSCGSQSHHQAMHSPRLTLAAILVLRRHRAPIPWVLCADLF